MSRSAQAQGEEAAWREWSVARERFNEARRKHNVVSQELQEDEQP